MGDASSSWDDNAFLGRVCAAVTGKHGEPAKPMAGAAARVALEVGATPESPVLLGNHPNPFNPRTEIGFALRAPGLGRGGLLSRLETGSWAATGKMVLVE
ncbi:MAG: hypothetical protein AB7V45_02440 [Candidatus Krumholzibacteriia bacterium]